jgi:hypothetical protein
MESGEGGRKMDACVNDNYAPGPSFHGELTHKVVLPPIPRKLLISISETAERADKAHEVAEFFFDQANQSATEALSEIPTLESEAREAEANYHKLIAERRKTDARFKRSVPNKEHPPSRSEKLAHIGWGFCFAAALAFVAAATANFVIDADLYPALGANIWMAALTTGIAVTVLIGGPICIYEAKETDEDKRVFARQMAVRGLTLGIAWLLLFALVDALDNYTQITLTQHRFHGLLSFLNTLLPAAEGVAKFLMVITQILGEAFGAVALELRAKRLKEAFRTPVCDKNPYYEDLQERIRVASQVAGDFAKRVRNLLELEVSLEQGRAVFSTLCIAELERFDKDTDIGAATARRKTINDQLKELQHA